MSPPLGAIFEPKLDYNDLDPGIRETVRWLQGLGFATTDSGDGVTKTDAIADGEALPQAHVVIRSTIEGMHEDAQRLRKVIDARFSVLYTGTDKLVQPGEIQGTYDPVDESAMVMLFNIDDEALGLPDQ